METRTPASPQPHSTVQLYHYHYYLGLFLVGIGAAASIPLIIQLYLALNDEPTLSNALSRWLENSWLWLTALTSIGIHAVTTAEALYQKVLITPSSIRYQSFNQPSWSLKWMTIKRAYLELPQTPNDRQNLYALKFHIQTLNTTYTLPSCIWLDLKQKLSKKVQSQLARVPEANLDELLRALPLIEQFRQRQIPVEVIRAKSPQTTHFALETSWVALSVVYLIFLTFGYSIIEFVVITEAYPTRPPISTYLYPALVTFIVSFAVLLYARVPQVESVMLALMLAGFTGVASHFATLRFNQVSDVQGTQTYLYVLQADLTMQPLAPKQPLGPDLPTIQWSVYFLDYWESFPTGSQHAIELRYGGLNFYQINTAPIQADMREYYIQQERQQE